MNIEMKNIFLAIIIFFILSCTKRSNHFPELAEIPDHLPKFEVLINKGNVFEGNEGINDSALTPFLIKSLNCGGLNLST